jgi:hypothetical protein
MAHTLCSAAQRRVAEHRRGLLAQLASVLAANTSSRSGRGSFVTDSLYHSRPSLSAASGSIGGDSCSPVHALLNAIDTSLRKEHAIEGVCVSVASDVCGRQSLQLKSFSALA